MKDYYYTVKDFAKGSYSEKGSKFLSFIYNIDSSDEVKIILEKVKKEFYDARHHVYAYSIGVEGDEYRANDDGEPSNSSGMPVLGQIRSKNLTNVLIVVARYFGGTKLGVPGLINAYKKSAEDAINNAKIIKKYVCDKINLDFDYEQISFVEKAISDYNLEVSSKEYTEKCKITVLVRKSEVDKVKKILKQNHKIKFSHNV